MTLERVNVAQILDFVDSLHDLAFAGITSGASGSTRMGKILKADAAQRSAKSLLDKVAVGAFVEWFPSSAASIERLAKAVSNPNSRLADVREQAIQICERIRDELARTYCLAFSGKEAEYLKLDGHPMGNEVANRFGATTRDSLEAVKCLAMQRGTASVFHAVRAVGVVLTALSKAANVQAPDINNWGVFLRELREAIHGTNGKPKPTVQVRTLLDAAYPCVEAVKRAWRDNTFHEQVFYTVEEAEVIWQHVSGLMRFMAKRLDQEGNVYDPSPVK